jgi:hypothetical protein
MYGGTIRDNANGLGGGVWVLSGSRAVPAVVKKKNKKRLAKEGWQRRG